MIYTCPVCQGSGFVPRKMYEVPGVTCSFGSYMNDNGVIQCNSCNGTGVVRKNDWIKCTDRMPPDMEPVIVTVDDKYYPSTKYSWIGRKNGNFWEILVGMSDTGDVYMGIGNPGNELTNVTHWMPMPEPAED